MNYNVLYGFHTPFDPKLFEPARLELAQKIVAQEKPDILVLTEACFALENWQQVKLDYALLFGFKHCFCAAFQPRSEWATCLLSKYPLTCEAVPFGTRQAIRALVAIKNKELHLDIIHPDPEHSDEEYCALSKPLLSTLKKSYIVTGDFNALSDEDSYDRAALVQGFHSFAGEKASLLADKLLACKFIPFIKSFGLRDLMPIKNRKCTIPTDLLNKDKTAGIRIDYFFASKDVICKDAWIVKNELSEKASDHYPVCCVIEV